VRSSLAGAAGSGPGRAHAQAHRYADPIAHLDRDAPSNSHRNAAATDADYYPAALGHAAAFGHAIYHGHAIAHGHHLADPHRRAGDPRDAAYAGAAGAAAAYFHTEPHAYGFAHGDAHFAYAHQHPPGVCRDVHARCRGGRHSDAGGRGNGHRRRSRRGCQPHLHDPALAGHAHAGAGQRTAVNARGLDPAGAVCHWPWLHRRHLARTHRSSEGYGPLIAAGRIPL
jgi:hypothetical protein